MARTVICAFRNFLQWVAHLNINDLVTIDLVSLINWVELENWLHRKIIYSDIDIADISVVNGPWQAHEILDACTFKSTCNIVHT